MKSEEFVYLGGEGCFGYDTIRHDTTRRDIVWYGMAWCGMVRYGKMSYSTVPEDRRNGHDTNKRTSWHLIHDATSWRAANTCRRAGRLPSCPRQVKAGKEHQDQGHLPQREFDQLSDGVDLLAAAPDLVVAHLVQAVVILAFDWLTCWRQWYKNQAFRSSSSAAVWGERG